MGTFVLSYNKNVSPAASSICTWGCVSLAVGHMSCFCGLRQSLVLRAPVQSYIAKHITQYIPRLPPSTPLVPPHV